MTKDLSALPVGAPASGRVPLRLAHRGDHRRYPENTLAAFRAALALPGCDGLEFDVRGARWLPGRCIGASRARGWRRWASRPSASRGRRWRGDRAPVLAPGEPK